MCLTARRQKVRSTAVLDGFELSSMRIVPLLWQSCDFDRLSWVLPSFQIIDFQRTFEDGCRDLLRLWGLGYQASH